MEMLVSLEEAQFRHCPKVAVEQPLEKFGRSTSSTWGVDMGIGQIKTAFRASGNDKMGKKEMWHQLNISRLIADFDRVQPTPTVEEKCRTDPDVLKTAFKVTAADLTIDEKDFLELASDSWQPPSPEHLRNIGCNTLVMYGVQDDPDALDTAWLARLCTQFHALQKLSCPQLAWLVVNTWQDDTLLWQLSPKQAKLSDGSVWRWFEFSKNTKRIYAVEVIKDVTDYRITELDIVVSKEIEIIFKNTPRETWPSGHCLQPKKWTTLLVGASWNGFNNLTVPYLQRIAVMPQVGCVFDNKKNKMPKTEKGILQVLTKALNPTYTDGQLADLVSVREFRKSAKSLDGGAGAVFMEGANLDLLEGLIDDEELKEMNEKKVKFVDAVAHAKRTSKHVAGAGGDGRAPAGGASASGGGGAAAAPRAKKTPIGIAVAGASAFDAKVLKSFLPGVRGTTCYIDLLWHNRVIVGYATAEPPHSKTQVFGPESRGQLTIMDAFLVCARWCWAEHTKATGEECEWEL